ncbi:unnamed protein product [Tilletia laevis]|nr:unnamed protein product [Tilletia laevis]
MTDRCPAKCHGEENSSPWQGVLTLSSYWPTLRRQWVQWMGTQRPSTHVHQPSTRDCHNDYHVGTKRRRTRNGSSSSSHHGPGAISLDRLRELAGAPEAISAGGGSKHQASRGTSTGTAPGVTLQPGELEKIMKNVEFGRQLFAELIGPFSTLQGMKDEAEDDKERAEEQLSEANERIRELQSRVISSPLPSSWMSGNVGAATSDTRLVRRLHQVPCPPGRPSRGRTSSASVPFGANVSSS